MWGILGRWVDSQRAKLIRRIAMRMDIVISAKSKRIMAEIVRRCRQHIFSNVHDIVSLTYLELPVYRDDRISRFLKSLGQTS